VSSLSHVDNTRPSTGSNTLYLHPHYPSHSIILAISMQTDTTPIHSGPANNNDTNGMNGDDGGGAGAAVAEEGERQRGCGRGCDQRRAHRVGKFSPSSTTTIATGRNKPGPVPRGRPRHRSDSSFDRDRDRALLVLPNHPLRVFVTVTAAGRVPMRWLSTWRAERRRPAPAVFPPAAHCPCLGSRV
jgi:hypothetical protein